LNYYFNEATELCYPAIKTIARDLALSERQVQRYLSEMEAQGFIRRVERRLEKSKAQTANGYEFLLHQCIAEAMVSSVKLRRDNRLEGGVTDMSPGGLGGDRYVTGGVTDMSPNQSNLREFIAPSELAVSTPSNSAGSEEKTLEPKPGKIEEQEDGQNRTPPYSPPPAAHRPATALERLRAQGVRSESRRIKGLPKPRGKRAQLKPPSPRALPFGYTMADERELQATLHEIWQSNPGLKEPGPNECRDVMLSAKGHPIRSVIEVVRRKEFADDMSRARTWALLTTIKLPRYFPERCIRPKRQDGSTGAPVGSIAAREQEKQARNERDQQEWFQLKGITAFSADSHEFSTQAEEFLEWQAQTRKTS
jgi:AraC-like DNA-binding protein